MAGINREASTKRCRCQDPEGKIWIYLSPFCLFRDGHKRLVEYGYPKNSTNTATEQYHSDWMSGKMNDILAEDARPGYRPPPRS
jgi:hypothetical protein